MKYNKIYLFCIALISLFASCEEEASFDMSYPKPVINSVSSYNAELGTDITLQGDFQEVSEVKFGGVNATTFSIDEDAKSLTVNVPRKTSKEGAQIIVSNHYNMTTVADELFVPIIPKTTISKVGDIQHELSFSVEGTNVDLITSLKVNGEEVSILKALPEKIIASVAGMGLNPGGLATVEITTLALDVIAPVKNVNIVYPFIIYNEVMIFDFEDGTHAYDGGGATIKEGVVNGKTEKYFELRTQGNGWGAPSGMMPASEVPDFSTIANPFITFCVRTPAGSDGYFQLEDQTGLWRHFSDYHYETNGEWVIISQPLEDNWEGGDSFNPATFKPRLTFKSAKAGEKQDVDIAYVKITEGMYDGAQKIGQVLGGSDKPAVISLLNFDDPSENPDIKNGENVIMSVNLRNEVPPFLGNGALGVIGDGTLPNWGGYWSLPIKADLTSTNLSTFEDPYISFAVNTNDDQQYIIFKIYQYDGKLAMAIKYFPQTNGKWQTFQFSIFNADLMNWSPMKDNKNPTELEKYFKSLKYLNPDEPIDKIEVIVSRNGLKAIEFSLDEVAITEGPRF